ncbi:cell wall metabolism sensor histidine kinase WalK [Desulfitobacterium sp. PCE1]|uniref:sensor histidine kinase n=1 Tax=Desulfitobacterium sp. PCE1 TaxID=146907 RepID=UPI00035EEF66|nr:ATP-binding protein [Desulfitobacterium sp. PCE1]
MITKANTNMIKATMIRLALCLSLSISAYWIAFNSYKWLSQWQEIAFTAAALVFVIMLTVTSNLKSNIWKGIISSALSLVVGIAEFSFTDDIFLSLGLASASFLFIIAFTGRYEGFLAFLNNLFSWIKGVCLKSLGLELFIFNLVSLLGAGLVYTALELLPPGLLPSFWFLPSSVILSIFAFFIINSFLIKNKVNYLKEIAGGILEISKGNLDFTVAVKGNDEFKVLAQNINYMSAQLKSKIEDEKRAEKTKNELITNVSHDLKTPLTTIIGYLSLLNDKKYETQDHLDEYLGKAYTKSLKLKKLIEDLFEYTKLSNGIIQVNKSSINLIELIEQQIGEISLLAKQNNLCFVKSFSHPTIEVEVDSDLMARVFENIFSNAIKYSYKDLPGDIAVHIKKDGNKVTVLIENQGDTIPTELLPLLFERFYRVDESRNSRMPGSGLGLAIAKSIVELHDGDIYAESEANKIRVCIVLQAI